MARFNRRLALLAALFSLIGGPLSAQTADRTIDEIKAETLARAQTGAYPALATHDEAMITQAERYAAGRGISKSKFEFQMLYGIRRDLQRRLVSEGYRLRLYIPYGKAWYPYFMRRLAERPANVLFLLRNLIR